MDTLFHSAFEGAQYGSRSYWESRFRREGLWPSYLEGHSTSERLSTAIDEMFPAWQLLLETYTHEVVGIANAVPLYAPTDAIQLPDDGWDWAANAAVEDHISGTKPNSVCLLSVTVFPQFRGQGFGLRFIQEYLVRAARAGFSRVIAPVRPVTKVEFPRVSMSEFICWTRPDGLHPDSWLRTHQRAGARIVNTCENSVTVEASLDDWRRWIGCVLTPGSDWRSIGCLKPITIDSEKGIAIYQEPNVWMMCDLSGI